MGSLKSSPVREGSDVRVSTLNSSIDGSEGDGSLRKLGECCYIVEQIEVTVELTAVIKCPEDKCLEDYIEDSIDDLESEFWPLMGDFMDSAEKKRIDMAFLGSTPSRSEKDEAKPYARRVISFSATYKFNPQEPNNVI